MRRLLWPDDPNEEHEKEVKAYLFGGDAARLASIGVSVGDVTVFVAERAGGGLCGFVEVSIRPFAEGIEGGPVGYVEGWYVDPDARRRGVGGALIEAAERWAKERGCRQMASDAHLENTVSILAHGSLGYREVGRAVHFAKELS
jgi:aminoglycoside 6'-N-acetyltransferase I